MMYYSPIIETPQGKEINNKQKTVFIVSNKKKKYQIDFINNINKLTIEAKLEEDLFPSSFINNFSLKDIKKVKFFNDDYESIDECLSEIFDKLDKNETKLIEENNELVIIIPLYTRKYPEIAFNLKLETKNDSKIINDLCCKLVEIKKEHEEEIKNLKNRIQYLENLLKVEKKISTISNQYKGLTMEFSFFGPEKFFDIIDKNQNYYSEKGAEIGYAFSFPCQKKEAIEIIKIFKENKDKIYKSEDPYEDEFGGFFIREKNDFIFIDFVGFNRQKDFFSELFGNIELFWKFFFTLINAKIILRSNAIPQDLFSEDTNKISSLVLDSEIEFQGLPLDLTPLFINLLDPIFECISFFGMLKLLINLSTGIKKIKLSDYIEKAKTEKLIENLQNAFFEIISFFKLDIYNKFKNMDFGEFGFHLISQANQVGMSFNFKIPKFNGFIEDILTNNIKMPNQLE